MRTAGGQRRVEEALGVKYMITRAQAASVQAAARRAAAPAAAILQNEMVSPKCRHCIVVVSSRAPSNMCSAVPPQHNAPTARSSTPGL